MATAERVPNAASRPDDLRLLIAFGDEYRAYGGAISSAIRVLRPRVRVEMTDTESLSRELDRFSPHAVICSRPEGHETGDTVAWVELPAEPDQPAHARLGDRRLELQNPSLEKMLELIDEAERLI